MNVKGACRPASRATAAAWHPAVAAASAATLCLRRTAIQRTLRGKQAAEQSSSSKMPCRCAS
eukprot:779824-Lingulodinium_polyedra.AAC.1